MHRAKLKDRHERSTCSIHTVQNGSKRKNLNNVVWNLAKRGESLIRQASNRYLTTVRIAFRAKQRRFDDFDGLLEESSVKPVQRSIIELSDEQDQPDLLPG